MKILVIHGPNLNMLGGRDPSKYGLKTLVEVNKEIEQKAAELHTGVLFYQSNHEGDLIDFIQKEGELADGMLINAGALTRYGYSLRQALVDCGKPVIEIHMSDIHKTGINKAVNIFDDLRIDQVVGLKEQSYIVGLEKLIDYVSKRS